MPMQFIDAQDVAKTSFLEDLGPLVTKAGLEAMKAYNDYKDFKAEDAVKKQMDEMKAGWQADQHTSDAQREAEAFRQRRFNEDFQNQITPPSNAGEAFARRNTMDFREGIDNMLAGTPFATPQPAPQLSDFSAMLARPKPFGFGSVFGR